MRSWSAAGPSGWRVRGVRHAGAFGSVSSSAMSPPLGHQGLLPGCWHPVGEANWGEDALMRMATASARAWPEFASELAADSRLDVGYDACGALHVALDRDEAEELRRRFELMELAGHRGGVAPRPRMSCARARARSCMCRGRPRPERSGDRPATSGRGARYRGGAPGGRGVDRCRGGRRAAGAWSPRRCRHSGRSRASGRPRGPGHRRLVRNLAVASARGAPAREAGQGTDPHAPRGAGLQAMRANRRLGTRLRGAPRGMAGWSSARPWRSVASTSR